MKASSKSVLAFFIVLVAISGLCIFSSVNAQTPTIDIEASVETTNQAIRQDASITFAISNVGTANISSANITAFDFINIRNLAVSPADWTITTQITDFGSFILLSAPDQGLSPGENLTFSFDATTPQTAGVYRWNIGLSQNAAPEGFASPETTETVGGPAFKIATIVPALAIVGIALGIAFLNSGINRVLINYFIGWEQYHVMQKEMNEHRKQMMTAARANDKKQMEKLKRKDSQIKSMQAKMMKPQMLQFGISFVYLIVWFLVLVPTFGSMSMAYLPGFGPIPVFYLYPIVSLFLGLISSRIIGITPIEPR